VNAGWEGIKGRGICNLGFGFHFAFQNILSPRGEERGEGELELLILIFNFYIFYMTYSVTKGFYNKMGKSGTGLPDEASAKSGLSSVALWPYEALA